MGATICFTKAKEKKAALSQSSYCTAAFSKIHYPGSKHTYSHGGRYSGGTGSSHKGGSYKNGRTGNRYGCHKGK